MQHDFNPKANKGEWSEIYVLFKIFTDKHISAAGNDLSPISDMNYTFLKVYREDTAGLRYEYDLQDKENVVIKNQLGEIVKAVSINDLSVKTKRIFQEINKKQIGAFDIPEAAVLMRNYMISKVKANSSQKVDLLADVANVIGGSSGELGFSIKSRAGGSSTLVNASSQTMFKYEIKGFTGNADEFNSMDGPGRIKRAIAHLIDQGAQIEFREILSKIYTSNLQYTDTMFPNILAEMNLAYYSSLGTKTSDIAKVVAENSSLGISAEQINYKIKGYLRASALGMVPSKPWSTLLDAYGGYIVVLEDGSLVCYHLHNDDAFKEYLFTQTFFDTPSTKNGGEFGRLYYEGDKLMLNLNLQIRFLK